MSDKIKKHIPLCLVLMTALLLFACAGNGVQVSARGDMTIGARVGSK